MNAATTTAENETESNELPRTVNGRHLVAARYYEGLSEQRFVQQYWTPEQIADGRRSDGSGTVFHLMSVL